MNEIPKVKKSPIPILARVKSTSSSDPFSDVLRFPSSGTPVRFAEVERLEQGRISFSE
jgi:hypothetical protein